MPNKALVAHSKVISLEHRTQALATKSVFARRVIIAFLTATLLTFMATFIGMLGFHYLAHLSWLESFYNASMMLSGMGVIDFMHTDATILFSGIYALFSSMMFVVIIGLLFVPIAHRIYHKFHLD